MPGPNGSIPTVCMYVCMYISIICMPCLHTHTFTELSRVLYVIFPPHPTSLHRVKGIPAVFLGSAQEASAATCGQIMK